VARVVVNTQSPTLLFAITGQIGEVQEQPAAPGVEAKTKKDAAALRFRTEDTHRPSIICRRDIGN